MSENYKKSQKGFIKNGIVFTFLFLLIITLFWMTHSSSLSSFSIFLIYAVLLAWLTFFALRFIVFPLIHPEDDKLMEKSKLFKEEDSLKDFRLKEDYVNVSYMKDFFINIFNSFYNFYYGKKNHNSSIINTSISEDILTVGDNQEDIREDNEQENENDILNDFDSISKDFMDKKAQIESDKINISENKKEIEDSIDFQKEYISSVKEEKDKISSFLQEQKEDLVKLIAQKNKEEKELLSLSQIESKVAVQLNSERKELKKLISSSRKELDLINKQRREVVYTISKNRNEAVRKTDLIKQIQQRRMALASIKKEKLQALNS